MINKDIYITAYRIHHILMRNPKGVGQVFNEWGVPATEPVNLLTVAHYANKFGPRFVQAIARELEHSNLSYAGGEEASTGKEKKSFWEGLNEGLQVIDDNAGAIGNIVALFGGGNKGGTPSPTPLPPQVIQVPVPQPTPAVPQSNDMLYVAIAVGVLAVIALFLFSNKK